MVQAIPLIMDEFQSKWIAGILSNRFAIPSHEEMMEDVKAHYSLLEASGKSKRYTHDIFDHQFEYDDWLAAQCGCPATEEWRKQMYIADLQKMLAKPETFRDEWDDHDLVLQAHENLKKYTSNGHVDLHQINVQEVAANVLCINV